MAAGLSIATFIKCINYQYDWMINGKLSRRFDEQTLPLLYDICCMLEPISVLDHGCQSLFDSWISGSQIVCHCAEYLLVAALSKVVTIETKEQAQFVVLIESDSHCVSDCRFSSASSTIGPEDGWSIWVWAVCPLLDLSENLNAGAIETLLCGVITSAMCIGQAIQLWIRSETHIGGEDYENLPKLSGSSSSFIRISTESTWCIIELQLTTIVLIKVISNTLNN